MVSVAQTTYCCSKAVVPVQPAAVAGAGVVAGLETAPATGAEESADRAGRALEFLGHGDAAFEDTAQLSRLRHEYQAWYDAHIAPLLAGQVFSTPTEKRRFLERTNEDLYAEWRGRCMDLQQAYLESHAAEFVSRGLGGKWVIVVDCKLVAIESSAEAATERSIELSSAACPDVSFMAELVSGPPEQCTMTSDSDDQRS